MKELRRPLNVVAAIALAVIWWGVGAFIAAGPASGRLSFTAFAAILGLITLAHLVGAAVAWHPGRSGRAALGLGASAISAFAWAVILWGGLALSVSEAAFRSPWLLVIALASAVVPSAAIVNFVALRRTIGEREASARET